MFQTFSSHLFWVILKTYENLWKPDQRIHCSWQPQWVQSCGGEKALKDGWRPVSILGAQRTNRYPRWITNEVMLPPSEIRFRPRFAYQLTCLALTINNLSHDKIGARQLHFPHFQPMLLSAHVAAISHSCGPQAPDFRRWSENIIIHWDQAAILANLTAFGIPGTFQVGILS